MPTYRLLVAYDGTRYAGWQKQPKLSTVEGMLETTFHKTFNESAALLGASRTDAGVHALGQVVRLRTSLAIDPQKLAFAFNNRLPEDILIRSAKRMHDDYSSHAGVSHKEYHYHIFTERPLPFIARYGWYYPCALSRERFEQALHCFVGEHDFRSFCSVEDTREHMVRHIQSIQLEYLRRFKAYRIAIVGSAFLRHMIRRLVGAALTVATEGSRYTIEDLHRILYTKNPHHPLPNAPSKGLLLHRITYHGVCDD